jgi:hypothetical protein
MKSGVDGVSRTAVPRSASSPPADRPRPARPAPDGDRAARAIVGETNLRASRTSAAPAMGAGDGPAGGEPFLQPVNGGRPFAAAPCSARLNDVAGLSGSEERVGSSAGGVTVMSAGSRTLDEAYERLDATGPEFDGLLSNHGPMAAEAMVRHGHGDVLGSWLEGYMGRLEEFLIGLSPIRSGWWDALGDLRRVARCGGCGWFYSSGLSRRQLALPSALRSCSLVRRIAGRPGPGMGARPR